MSLFPGAQYGRGWDSYDIAPDGKRFLMLKNVATLTERQAAERTIVIQDWLNELRANVPATR